MSPIISSILPRAAQNSVSPYHLTAIRLMIAYSTCARINVSENLTDHRSETTTHHNNSNHRPSRHSIAPKVNNNITRRHLKWHQYRLEDEKVPPSGEPEGLVGVTTRETDKWRRDWQVCHHFRHTEGDGENDRAPQGESDEETRRAAIEEATADLDVECCADGASDARSCELVVFCYEKSV